MSTKKSINKLKTLFLISTFYITTVIVIILFFTYICNAELTNIESNSVNWEKLKESSQHILKLNNNDILANFQYSISLANLGMIEEAYDHFQIIKDKISISKFNRIISPYISKLELHPNDILLLNYAAFSSSINSENKKSIPHFKKILDLEPKNIWIRNFLAAAYLELEEYDKAKKEVNKALEIKDNKYSHLLLGIVHYNTGNILGALFELGHSGNLVGKIISKNN